MAITIDWPNQEITVQKTDTDICTLVSGTLYRVDTNALWEEIKALEDNEQGINWLKIVDRNPAVTISGVEYAPAFTITNGYKLKFMPDEQWTALMDGASNNNFADVQAGVLVQNSVQVIPQNSAGNTITETGTSGLTPTESATLTQAANDASSAATSSATAAAEAALAKAQAALAFVEAELGRKLIDANEILTEDLDDNWTIIDPDDGSTVLRTRTVRDKDDGPIILGDGAPARRTKT